MMYWFCTGRILLASTYYTLNLDLETRARLFKKNQPLRYPANKILKHELVLDCYESICYKHTHTHKKRAVE